MCFINEISFLPIQVRGLWCLDHNRWAEGYSLLKKVPKDIPTWLHYSIILLLLLKREDQRAYQYSLDFKPECNTEDQVKYCQAYEHKELVKRRHASNLVPSAQGNASETEAMEQFIWVTDKKVDYMYNRLVPNLNKEEYMRDKRDVSTTPLNVSSQNRKRLADAADTTVLTNSTKRGRYEFEFEFAPIPRPKVNDTLGSPTLPLVKADPNISAILSTPYVHKKGDRAPPAELMESVAPGSTQKPNKSLLKTPGSSSSVKKVNTLPLM
ncbi:hypothetical protein WDU94_006088 [Cyamophila willieti]